MILTTPTSTTSTNLSEPSDNEVWELGYAAFQRGWTKIPPATVVRQRLGTKEREGMASVWIRGYDAAKRDEVFAYHEI